MIHELIHYKRKDIYYKWLVQVVWCIHWFNPLLYLVVGEINRLCELSCDEAVISFLELDGERREYAGVLLEAVVPENTYKDNITSLTLSEEKND